MMNITIGVPVIVYDDNKNYPYIDFDGAGGGRSGVTRNGFLNQGIEKVFKDNYVPLANRPHEYLFGGSIIRYSLVKEIIQRIIEETEFADLQDTINEALLKHKEEDLYIQFS